MSISKSSIKATDCEQYYAGYFLKRAPQLIQGFTQTGTEFHGYRCDYVNHLIESSLDKDPAWVEEWLRAHAVSIEGRALIERDALGFYLDPQDVYGTEVFLCVDALFRPIEHCARPAPGQQPADPNAYLHGTIDRIDLSGARATLHDYKTGWIIKPDEREAAVYALLAFCCFPQIEEVHFFWEFKRAGNIKSRFTRKDDMGYLRGAIMKYHQQELGIASKVQSGAEISVNPFAGLCTYCDLVCPVRAGGLLPAGPIQNKDGAIAAAGYLRAVKRTTAAVEKMLKRWIESQGPVSCPNGVEAKISIGSSLKVDLNGMLDVLGVQVEEDDLHYDVPLSSLRIGLTELKKQFKKDRDLETECEERFPRESYARLSVSGGSGDEEEIS